ncbi:lysosomal acid phosphatase-like [Venturia canescens]|uniref:lysosomal acid phosphatase-like n=1 Tax=Venturia canescens TaxID=32260 RepID=UPI001C9D61A6|nr:lysosomal acid phosphatase-like [Venturia canescens]
MHQTRSFIATNCRSGRRGIFVSVIILGFILCSILLAHTAFSPGSDYRNVKQVAIIFRHGDRTPTETYPKDPHINHEWEDGWGALTRKGMAQEYTLGQWIRSEYGSIIGPKYESSKTLVRSSYADRCIMSAQALLAGLFRPDVGDYFVPEMPWRPVPVHTTPRNLDKLIVVEADCPRMRAAVAETYKNESKRSDAQLHDYYKKLEEYTGQRMRTITDVELLYNTLEIEEDNGLTLPDWTKEFYNSEMRDIAARSYALFSSNTVLKRLRAGPLLKEVLDRMVDWVDQKNQRTLYLYSAHDVTLITLLRTMGFEEKMYKPAYGAALIFELVAGKEEHDFEVQIRYLNDTETNESHHMRLPACPERCGLQELYEIWKDVIPEDWDAECKL